MPPEENNWNIGHTENPTNPTNEGEGGSAPANDPAKEKKEEPKVLGENEVALSKEDLEKYEKLKEKDHNFEELRKQIKENKKTPEKEFDSSKIEVPNKDIKWSKDLSEEERENMSQSTIETMDRLARMEERENNAYIESKKSEFERNNPTNEYYNPGKFEVQEIALDIVGDDRQVAKELISLASEMNLLSKADNPEELAGYMKLLKEEATKRAGVDKTQESQGGTGGGSAPSDGKTSGISKEDEALIDAHAKGQNDYNSDYKIV